MKEIREKRIKRVRAKISGTAERPRLAVFKSLKHISCQLIDDVKGVTIASASDVDVKDSKNKAEEVGKLIAKKAAEKKIKEAVFDRRSYKYHGNIKALADGARAGGLSI